MGVFDKEEVAKPKGPVMVTYVHAKTKQKAISLPPISVSALSKEEMQKLSKLLKNRVVGK